MIMLILRLILLLVFMWCSVVMLIVCGIRLIENL